MSIHMDKAPLDLGSAIGSIFDAYTDLTIKAATIYAGSTNSKRIWLKNSSGTILDSVWTSLSGTQTITLNFNVPAGSGYSLGSDAACNLWRETSGASYPYTTSGLLSITGNTMGSTDHYYYCYNWQVQANPCTSPRVPVIASVLTGINEYLNGNCAIYPNPTTDNLTIDVSATLNTLAIIEISNIQGQVIEQQTTNVETTNLVVSALAKGMYFVKVITEKGVMSRKFVKL